MIFFKHHAIEWCSPKLTHLVVASSTASVALGIVFIMTQTYLKANTYPNAQQVQVLASHENLAKRIGELQAKLAQLEALSTELSLKAGIDYEPLEGKGAQGGPLLRNGSDDSPEALSKALLSIENAISLQSDKLKALDGQVVYSFLNDNLSPNLLPVRTGLISSPYGQRIDPIRGGWALHNGQDFAAPYGTPIYAAGGGVVIDAKYHSAYGKMVDIRHPDGLVTRYAHAATIIVQKGDLVKPGQQIATVGSTGRSTGPHLHFEVLDQGRALNPSNYLGIDKILNQRRSVDGIATQTR